MWRLPAFFVWLIEGFAEAAAPVWIALPPSSGPTVPPTGVDDEDPCSRSL